MYETHFGFRERPFRATPDTGAYYPATGHERALARLADALRDDEAIVLLTGDPGTGKTLLCHCLLERLGDGATTAFLTHGHFAGRAGLLQAILYDFSLPYEGRGEQELRLALIDFLLQQFAGGRRTVLVLDEAHHLTAAQLEELRLLANLEARQARALQVVLAAQPSLLDALQRPELAALAQRLAVRARLAPLGLPEAADYLLHQVRAAGGRPEAVLTDEAIEVLAGGARGVPRLLNQAAHQALALACAAGAPAVDAEAALEVLALLGLAEGGGTSAEPLAEASADGRPEPTGVLVLGDAGDESGPQPETGDPDEPACRLFPAPRRPA
jgi:type II secretory pathway predicted ATPase ExeA